VKKTVVLGFLGTQLDSGGGANRWERWRPTIALLQREDLLIDRFELFHVHHEKMVEAIRADIKTVSPETELVERKLYIRDAWDFGDVYGALFDFAKSYDFKPDEETYWIHITTGTHVAQICLFLMVEARYFPGVLLQTSPPKKQKAGATGEYALIDLDLKRYNQLAQRFNREQEDAIAFLKSGIETRNTGFNKLVEEIEQVAVRSKAPMLLMGPTGAGKSFLAKRLFALKKARHTIGGAMVEVNCATLRGDTAASTLFGHVRGAFTGAANARLGLLRTAHLGVLFLDEIGELGLDEQAMLLKAIEEKRFFPVGADEEVESDFQLIVGTNRDLREAVLAGRFREDLFARINMWTYTLPGLAQRVEDIEPNLEYLLAQFCQEAGEFVRFNLEAKKQYLNFATAPEATWNGNFRDLSASVNRLATLATGGRITVELVTAEIARLRHLWRGEAVVAGEQNIARQLVGEAAFSALDLFDQLQLNSVLNELRKHRTISDAGRHLFAASRIEKGSSNDGDRLRKYLAKYGLSWAVVCG
jgi:transcriptional regulatory protein RtcR